MLRTSKFKLLRMIRIVIVLVLAMMLHTVLREAQAFDFRGINAAGCRRALTSMLVQEEYELHLARMAYIEQGVTRGQPD